MASSIIEIIIILLIIVYAGYYYLKRQSETFEDNYPSNPSQGIVPLILQNTEELPIIPIKTTALGTAGYFTAKCIRKLIYPVDPIITYYTNTELLDSLGPDEIGIVREHVLLSSSNPDNYKVLAPAYYETVLCIANKYSQLTNIIDLLIPKTNGTKNVIGVLADSMHLFSIICKNRNIQIGQADSKFTVVPYNIASDMFLNLSTRVLDAIFILTHPKDTTVQTYCNNNQVRLLDIEPRAGSEGKAQLPFNADDENQLVVFNENMKRDVPWIFKEAMSVNKIPNASLSALKGASRSTGNITIERVVYNTYKVRSLIIYFMPKNQNQRPIILNSGGRHMPGLASRLVKQYNTMAQLFNKWNPVDNMLVGSGGDARTTNRLASNNGSMLDITDMDSFNFSRLATIPMELELDDSIKAELSVVGLIKTESETRCAV